MRRVSWNLASRHATVQKLLVRRKLNRATKSCCRQSLRISAINYTGWALELGGIINLVDQRVSERRLLSRAKLIARSVDMPWWNFPSPEFRKKFHFSIFADIWISLKHSVGLVEKSLHAKKPARSVQPLQQNTYLWQTDRQTQAHWLYRACIASRGKNCSIKSSTSRNSRPFEAKRAIV